MTYNTSHQTDCKQYIKFYKGKKMKNRKYLCPKCENRYAKVDKIRTTGPGFTRYFNIQNRKFTAVTCSKCGYTEFYRDGVADAGSNVLDFLAG